MSWYKGKTLLQALSELQQPPREHLRDKPFRFIMRKQVRVSGVGKVLMGRVVSGRLQPGMEVCVRNFE